MTGCLGRYRNAWKGDDSTIGEVEIAIHEWLHMQEHSLETNGIFKLMRRQDKCTSVFGYCSKKL